MPDAPEAGAASVASQLLAFWREPVLHRPRYIHGQQPLPEGHVVLKFALGRFSHAWHEHLAAPDREVLRAAANAFVRQVCLWERASHYQILCAQPDADAEAIKENYRLLMALLHPDRQDPAQAAWPTGCAQRVNQAYATLSDQSLRAAYDEGLALAQASAAVEAMAGGFGAPVEQRRMRHGTDLAGLARRALIVSGVIAALFVVQAWWVRDLPHEYSLLERALPTDAPARWVRDVLPGVGLPRFLEGRATTAFTPVESAPLEPLKEPRPLGAMRVAAAIPEAPALLPTSPANAAPESAAPSRTSSPSAQIEAAPEAAPPTLRMAQAVLPANAAAGAPTTEQIEILVALLVSHYDAGDADRLVGLFDRDQLGFWQGYRTRGAYADFFRATKQRRLRMDRLAWRSVPQGVVAKGDATVIAEFHDGAARLERRVEVELDIALREGAARITRLSLFPNGP